MEEKKYVYVLKDDRTNSTVKLVLAVYDDLEKAKKFADKYIEFLTKYRDPYDVDIFLENREDADGTYDIGTVWLKEKVVHLYIERYQMNWNLFNE